MVLQRRAFAFQHVAHAPQAAEFAVAVEAAAEDRVDDRAVTVRERDSMEQERVAVGELVAYLRERLD